MSPIRERLGHERSTPRAPLGRAGGVHLLRTATSFVGFIAAHLDQLAPPGIVDRLVHATPSLGHAAHVKILESDEAVRLRQPVRELVQNVLSLPRRLGVEALNLSLGSFAPRRRMSALGFL